MYSPNPIQLFALSALAGLVLAQPGPPNTQPGCVILSEATDTFYYNPASIDNVGMYGQGVGCDAASYGQVILADSGFNTIVDCGYYPLDGRVFLINCPNYPSGAAPAGTYNFLLYPGGNSGFFRPFTITHTQETREAPTPTATAFETPTSTITDTSTISPTETVTAAQVTVTSPSVTYTNTIKITPRNTKVTVTSTITRTRVKPEYTKSVKTITQTADCPETTLSPCQKNTRRDLSAPAALKKRANRFQKRDTPNRGGLSGDGPLTTTTTPPPVLVTQTEPAVTETVTDTTTAVEVTITVPPTPATSTIYSGAACDSTTTTLPQVTKTYTKKKYTVATSTKTITITYTRTKTTTPACAPTNGGADN